jgi:hypothetical protein
MRLSPFFVIAGVAIAAAQVPVIAADLNIQEPSLPDHRTCLEMAREEGRFIVEISVLHPVVKHHKHDEAAKHVHALKQEKQDVHHERRRVECI